MHPRFGRIADIAREYRPAVARRIAPGEARRAFWDDVLGGAAADAILAGDEPAGRAAIERRLEGTAVDEAAPGRVLLVGAGPGDPELLTLKAVRALKSADVILHDGHVSQGVLDYARREAQLISVAKARGRHSRTQAEINALIVALARQGKTVVRLKGGDPFVFGRGGEEIDILRASGIPVEVVPGITAATAASASLQIPLTHRDIARSVTFISGHAAGDGAADFDQVDFAALANRRSTLAVYMGLATAGALAQTLLAAGWSQGDTGDRGRARLAAAGAARRHNPRPARRDPFEPRAVRPDTAAGGRGCEPACGRDHQPRGARSRPTIRSLPMPSVVTANNLRTGLVVYLGPGARWVRDLRDASIAIDASDLATLEAQALAAVESTEVTAVYAMDIRIVDGKPEPVSVRERIRAAQSATV